jgi:hypothetical protein
MPLVPIYLLTHNPECGTKLMYRKWIVTTLCPFTDAAAVRLSSVVRQSDRNINRDSAVTPFAPPTEVVAMKER